MKQRLLRKLLQEERELKERLLEVQFTIEVLSGKVAIEGAHQERGTLGELILDILAGSKKSALTHREIIDQLRTLPDSHYQRPSMAQISYGSLRELVAQGKVSKTSERPYRYSLTIKPGTAKR
jgi:hypothetical protein